MPCSGKKARMLLKEGKAKCVSKVPFTIKLLFGASGYKQEIVAGMDTGSKNIGVAVISNGKVLYQAETKLRGEEIKKKMVARSMYRRTRRGRKTRYRAPRFLNRGASIQSGRLPPSIKHKIDAHLREKRFVESISPVSKWILETASFDIHKITNPESVSKAQGCTYQQGPQMDFYNVKQFILDRDKYTCQKCNKGNMRLHVHHIIFRCRGGTNSPTNLVTLCKKCHDQIHAFPNGEKESLKLQKSVQKHTKHATEISILRSQLNKKFGEFEETFGYITKFNRESLGLPKTHACDAICIAAQGEVLNPSNVTFQKRCVSKGDYQQTSGARSEKKIPTGKLFGLRKFDLIRTSKGIGFVKGKRSSGYFAISTLDNKTICESVKVKNITNNKGRIQPRKATLIWRTQFLPALKDGVSLRKIR